MAVKKIISRVPKSTESIEESAKQVVEEESPREGRSKRGCFFCGSKSDPTYTDLATLRRFLTDRAKIVNKERSGVCSKHQRQVAKHIKYARHLSLLPFVPKV